MKLIHLCKSVLLSFISKNKLLSVFALIISMLAIYSFTGSVALFLSPFDEADLQKNCKYYVTVDKDKLGELQSTFDSLPKIIDFGKSNCTLYYSLNNSKYLYYENFDTVFPTEISDLFRYINTEYTIITGRDYTREEILDFDGNIIVSEETGLAVGDKFNTEINEKPIAFNVIGVSDRAVMPFSFYEEYNQPCSIGFVFDENLNESQLSALSGVFSDVSVIAPREDNPISYFLYFSLGIVLCVFSALQIYGIFLYMASKVRYNLRIMKITGCPGGYINLISFIIIICYTVVSLLLALLFSPLFEKLFISFRLIYVPVFTDYLLSFAVYTVIVIIAVIPGVRKLSEKLLCEDGEIK